MFGIGLNVTLSSFKNVFRQPKAVLLGLGLQIILLPLIAFLIADWWKMAPEYKLGLILISACPGGTGSNLVTHILRGRVALSITLTAFNSFIILLSLPLIMEVSTNYYASDHEAFSLSFWDTFTKVGLTVVLPVFIAVVFRHYLPNNVKRIDRYLDYILPVLLLSIFIISALSDNGENISYTWDLLKLALPALVLNVSTILLGYGIASLSGIKPDGSFTIAIELGLQNSALAIFVAEGIFSNSQMALMAIIYSSFTFFTSLGLAYILKIKPWKKE